MNLLLTLFILFLAAFANKKIAPLLRIPEVTGYVLIGILLSAFSALFVERSVFDAALDHLDIISQMALAVIGFSIGVELKWTTIKKLGRCIFFIVPLETGLAFLFVFIAMRLFGLELYVCLLIGAVASATAPAATVAVIRQYKAKGELTSSILAVVGIDDAFALAFYVIAASFAHNLIQGESAAPGAMLLTILSSIFGSVAIGLIFAAIYLLLVRKLKDTDTIELLLVAFLFALLGLSESTHVSELLTIMTFGAVLTNCSSNITAKSESIVNKFTSILVGAFFITGGAHFDVRVIGSVFVVGLIFFAARSGGKMLGAGLGAYLGKAPLVIKRYLGCTLLPQVGVAVALVIAIKKDFPGATVLGMDLAYFVFNILLFTTLITESLGPVLTKRALIKAKEIEN